MAALLGPTPPPPLGHPLPRGAAVEVQQFATELADAQFAWQQSRPGRPFPGVKAGGTTVKRLEQLLWHEAELSGDFDGATCRYLEVTFADGDPDGRRNVLPQYVRRPFVM